MRLEEWQKFIESQFLEDGGANDTAKSEQKAEPQAAEEKPIVAKPVVEAKTPSPHSAPFVPFTPDTNRPSGEIGNREAKPLITPPAPVDALARTLPFAEETPVLPIVPIGLLKDNSEATQELSVAMYPKTLDFDADIPDFANYLPSARSSTAPLAPASEPKPETAPPQPVGVRPTPKPKTNRTNETERDADLRSSRPSRSRARHARNVRPENVPSGLSAAEMWADVPRHVQTLLALERIEEKEIAQSSYKRPFAEGRLELIERLLDPILSLEDTARLLNVCPTTVRRYTNRGILTHYRKEPERNGELARLTERETRQRRFRLSDILAFLETQQVALEADRKPERQKVPIT